MSTNFAPGDIVQIEHAVRSNSNVVHDVLWPPSQHETTHVWRNGEAVPIREFRRIETSGDDITLVTATQRATAKASRESQPGMVTGEVIGVEPSNP